MTGSTAPTRAPGRPREFDVDEALDRAVEMFREFGFEATSMAELERATGLNKSSIYNTFESKENLFRRSLEHYETSRLSSISDVLAAGTGGLDDLHRVLDLQREENQSPWGSQGCLSVNAMAATNIKYAAALLISLTLGVGVLMRGRVSAAELDDLSAVKAWIGSTP